VGVVNESLGAEPIGTSASDIHEFPSIDENRETRLGPELAIRPPQKSQEFTMALSRRAFSGDCSFEDMDRREHGLPPVALAFERHHGSASALPETASLASGAPTKNS
jgi:hypothetical protein